jgi:hypothetical protein
MADLIFDGNAHTITLRDRTGRIVGTWPANNRTDSRATLRFVPNGNYTVQDSVAPNRHGAEDSTSGQYGTRGIVRFNVPGHDGVGVHAGRQGVPDLTPERRAGPDHVTEGCIRTTEEAMGAIVDAMRGGSLTNIQVVNNRNQRQ